MENRIYSWYLLMILGFVLLIFRAYDICVTKNSMFLSMRAEQIMRMQLLIGNRGKILDRNGVVLAHDTPSVSVFISDVGDTAKNEQFLTALTGVSQERLQKTIEKAKKFAWLARQLPITRLDSISKYVSKKIDVSAISYGYKSYFLNYGFGYIIEPKRKYVYENVASHIIGFTGVDNQGLAGLELEYDSKLKARKDKKILQVDALGSVLSTIKEVHQSDIDGFDIHTTIDIVLNTKIAGVLNSFRRKYNIIQANIDVMNASSGEIVSSYSIPGYDPNNYLEYSSIIYDRNPLIHEQKKFVSPLFLILSAILFEKGVFDKDNTVSSHFETMIPVLRGKVIRDQSILDSITENIDRVEYFKYCKSFGLGIPTGIDLPGEKAGELSRDPEITVNNIMRLTSTTPLQALRTIAIIVNQGKKVVPRLALKEGKKERRDEEKLLLKMTADGLKRYLSGYNDNSGRYINIHYNIEYGGLTEHVGFDSNTISYLGYISNMGEVYVFNLSVKGDMDSTVMERVAKEIVRNVDSILYRFIEESNQANSSDAK